VVGFTNTSSQEFQISQDHLKLRSGMRGTQLGVQIVSRTTAISIRLDHMEFACARTNPNFASLQRGWPPSDEHELHDPPLFTIPPALLFGTEGNAFAFELSVLVLRTALWVVSLSRKLTTGRTTSSYHNFLSVGMHGDAAAVVVRDL
jgi:hypothetical protein